AVPHRGVRDAPDLRRAGVGVGLHRAGRGHVRPVLERPLVGLGGGALLAGSGAGQILGTQVGIVAHIAPPVGMPSTTRAIRNTNVEEREMGWAQASVYAINQSRGTR